jgi:hypothetical protein
MVKAAQWYGNSILDRPARAGKCRGSKKRDNRTIEKNAFTHEISVLGFIVEEFIFLMITENTQSYNREIILENPEAH